MTKRRARAGPAAAVARRARRTGSSSRGVGLALAAAAIYWLADEAGPISGSVVDLEFEAKFPLKFGTGAGFVDRPRAAVGTPDTELITRAQGADRLGYRADGADGV